MELNTSIRLSTMIKLASSQRWRDGLTHKKCNSSYKQTQEGKLHDHLIGCRIGSRQIPTSPFDKSYGELRAKGTYLFSRGTVQQAFSQCHDKWRKPQHVQQNKKQDKGYHESILSGEAYKIGHKSPNSIRLSATVYIHPKFSIFLRTFLSTAATYHFRKAELLCTYDMKGCMLNSGQWSSTVNMKLCGSNAVLQLFTWVIFYESLS